MIIKGNRRGGAKQAAQHLLNAEDNEHVFQVEVRGFMTNRLDEALNEIYAQSRANKNIKKFLYSTSLNPPEGEFVSDEEFIDVANRMEASLDLQGQPRAIVVHEKEGRRHAHAVWSRIDENLKAIELKNDWPKLMALSRDIYLERGWDMPKGLKKFHERDRSNYKLADHQAAKRRELNPKEVKATLRGLWEQSKDLASFQTALSEHGYQLAQGDKPIFMLVDKYGDIRALHRAISVKSAYLKARLGEPTTLQTVDEAKANIKAQQQNLQQQPTDLLQEHQTQIAPVKTQLFDMKISHRRARLDLKAFHDKRQQQERAQRQSQYQKGLKALWHLITGRYKSLKRKHEAEYQQNLKRDRAERHALIQAQLKDRTDLQTPLKAMRERHQSERLEMLGQPRHIQPDLDHKHTHQIKHTHSPQWEL
jgi:hypothetical protein